MIRIAMTRPQFEAKKVEVEQGLGLTSMGDEGQGEHSGVKIGYKFDGSALDLTVLHKPFFLSESEVEDKITAYFAAA